MIDLHIRDTCGRFNTYCKLIDIGIYVYVCIRCCFFHNIKRLIVTFPSHSGNLVHSAFCKMFSRLPSWHNCEQQSWLSETDIMTDIMTQGDRDIGVEKIKCRDGYISAIAIGVSKCLMLSVWIVSRCMCVIICRVVSDRTKVLKPKPKPRLFF